MLIYKCDFCRTEHSDKEGLVVLGSSSGRDLYFENESAVQGVRKLSNYRDLHFCAFGCFLSFFTNEKPAK